MLTRPAIIAHLRASSNWPLVETLARCLALLDSGNETERRHALAVAEHAMKDLQK